MDSQKVLQLLKDEPRLGLVEAYHVSTFRGTRDKKNGELENFTVTILDAGPTPWTAGPV